MIYSTNRFISSASFRLFKLEFRARKCTSILPAIEKISLHPTVQTKSEKEPFMKNVFLGKFDKDFLIYPEILNKEEIEDIEKRVSFLRQTLETKEKSENAEEKTTMFEELVKSGILKLQAPVDYGGFEVKTTHITKTCDSLKLNHSEALLLDIHRSLIIETIVKYGTDFHKQKYLRKLLNGEITGAYALSDESRDTDALSIETTATFCEDENHFLINGNKKWVTNGKNADFFIIFAQIKNYSSHKDIKKLAAFIVEKDSNSFSFSAPKMSGPNDCGICDIKLHNVVATQENLLGGDDEGYEISTFGLQLQNHFLPSSILGSLKDIFQETTELVKPRKFFSKDLKDSENVKAKLGKVGVTIYTLESMMYLLSGALDQYEIDTRLESAIIQVFAYEKCLESYKTCLDLIGKLNYDKQIAYSEKLNDIYNVMLSVNTTVIIKLFISLCGLEYAGLKMASIVQKMRHPFNFPGFFFRKLISSYKHNRDTPNLDQQLYMNLHPSLRSASEQLEYSVTRFNYAIENVLVNHGTAVVDHDLDLVRIADIAVHIFAMTSVLGRASRSYCTGVRHCDDEVLISRAICQDSTISVRKLVEDLVGGVTYTTDHIHLNIGSNVVQNGGYYLEHPTVKNIN